MEIFVVHRQHKPNAQLRETAATPSKEVLGGSAYWGIVKLMEYVITERPAVPSPLPTPPALSAEPAASTVITPVNASMNQLGNTQTPLCKLAPELKRAQLVMAVMLGTLNQRGPYLPAEISTLTARAQPHSVVFPPTSLLF